MYVASTTRRTANQRKRVEAPGPARHVVPGNGTSEGGGGESQGHVPEEFAHSLYHSLHRKVLSLGALPLFVLRQLEVGPNRCSVSASPGATG